MTDELKVPKFENESDEAKWWDSHTDDISNAFERAAAEGSLGRGTAKKKGTTPTTTIRLDKADIARARTQAERKGLKYQTYLKMLLRESLLREDERIAAVAKRA
jgi:predicted DNA binding CopG/RHH family protein